MWLRSHDSTGDLIQGVLKAWKVPKSTVSSSCEFDHALEIVEAQSQVDQLSYLQRAIETVQKARSENIEIPEDLLSRVQASRLELDHQFGTLSKKELIEHSATTKASIETHESVTWEIYETMDLLTNASQDPSDPETVQPSVDPQEDLEIHAEWGDIYAEANHQTGKYHYQVEPKNGPVADFGFLNATPLVRFKVAVNANSTVKSELYVLYEPLIDSVHSEHQFRFLLVSEEGATLSGGIKGYDGLHVFPQPDGSVIVSDAAIKHAVHTVISSTK